MNEFRISYSYHTICHRLISFILRARMCTNISHKYYIVYIICIENDTIHLSRNDEDYFIGYQFLR